MNSYQTGVWGEVQAAWHLRKAGMRIVARRFRTAHGEIDLIAQDGGATVFVEVKSRPCGAAGEGIAAIDAKKRAHLRFAAQVYLWSHPSDEVRFDVIELSADGIRHIKNAF